LAVSRASYSFDFSVRNRNKAPIGDLGGGAPLNWGNFKSQDLNDASPNKSKRMGRIAEPTAGEIGKKRNWKLWLILAFVLLPALLFALYTWATLHYAYLNGRACRLCAEDFE